MNQLSFRLAVSIPCHSNHITSLLTIHLDIYTTVNTPVDVVGYESSWLLLSCDHVISLPQATVLWLEEDLIERPVTGSDSLETLLNGSLLFSNLSSANEAMYICHASNPSTQEFRRVVYNLTVSTGKIPSLFEVIYP